MVEPVIDVRDLRVSFRDESGLVNVVNGVSFALVAGEILCIVGESGCGKSVTAQSIIGLIRSDEATILSGQVHYGGRDLLRTDEKQMRRIRGKEISMIFQDPMTSLNPLHRVGSQVGEMLSAHTNLSRHNIRRRVIELFRQVRIPDPEQRIDDYPHQFSGGMRQRVMIAMALACGPSLLIADEPTTALDVTVQALILDLIKDVKYQHEAAVILITHDLGIVAEVADKVLVMYAGQCVEFGGVREIFYDPQHPYTCGLLASIPSANKGRTDRLPSIRGTPPSLIGDLPRGCVFRPRCDYAFEKCNEAPPLESRTGKSSHLDRCWLPGEDRKRCREAAMVSRETSA